MSRIYVYALVDGAFPPIRRHGRTIEVVEIDGAGGVFAAVERSDQLPAVSEAALEVQHDLVTCIAAVADAILPARFGSLVDEVELEQLVALRMTQGEETVQARKVLNAAALTYVAAAAASIAQLAYFIFRAYTRR